MTSRGFEDVFFASTDGLRLHARIYGSAEQGLPVVCLPGLTRNVRDFHELAIVLTSRPGRRRRVIAFDYRGRGQSDWAADWKSYDVVTETRDLMAGLAALEIATSLFIGTSRGGLILHVLAAMQPDLIAGAVLNDIGPVVEAAGLAHIRAYLAGARKPATMADAAALQREIHGAAFPALTDADWERLAQALYREVDGMPVGDFDPALLNVLAAFDPSRAQPTLWPQFDILAQKRLLVIRGENSTLLSPATLREMQARSAACQAITVAGQGHPPMLETRDLPARIADFLDRAELGAS